MMISSGKIIFLKQASVLLFFFLVLLCPCFGQHTNILTATIDAATKEISIQQEFEYVNTSNQTLDVVY
ncbi:MAG: hypothetical protein WBM83_07060, partial [Flavobacteriaceae bacterium]